MGNHDLYMQRCLQLASMAAGTSAPNPMVGAVLVHNDIIIGEGYTQPYGGAHAEVMCLNTVAQNNTQLIAKSTLYVSLEPCAHFGKTPPCCDLIIKNKVPHVVIACRDIYKKVNGEGIRKMLDAGITVTEDICNQEATEFNRRFFTFHKKSRPYIILKWAQTADLMIAQKDFKAINISNVFTNKMVHRWRSEEAAIVVGYNTALHDNPALNTRLWPGKSPVRMVIDRKLQLPDDLKIFHGSGQTVVLNEVKEESCGHISYRKIRKTETPVQALLRTLFKANLTSVIIEGGTKTLQLFIDANIWDEARVITNASMTIGDGIPAPVFAGAGLLSTPGLFSDEIKIFRNYTPAG